MGKQSCSYKQKLKKGLWSPEEDEKLVEHITKYGHGSWSSVPKLAGLQRCGKSCRLRWINYLRPDLKRGTFSQQEEDLIIRLHEAMGNKWSQIAAQLPGRTDNEIKNYWNSSIKKKLMQSESIPANTQLKHIRLQKPCAVTPWPQVRRIDCPRILSRIHQHCPWCHLLFHQSRTQSSQPTSMSWGLAIPAEVSLSCRVLVFFLTVASSNGWSYCPTKVFQSTSMVSQKN